MEIFNRIDPSETYVERHKETLILTAADIRCGQGL